MAENIVKVGAGEYCTVYMTDAGNAYKPVWSGSSIVIKKVFSSKVKDLDGGQYHVAMTDTDGFAYNVAQDGSVTKLPVSNVEKAYGFFTSTVLLYKNGTIGIVGDWMGVTSFTQPTGKIFKKLVVSSTDQKSLRAIYALTTDGVLYKYTNSTPTLVLTGVTDFGVAGIMAVVAQTATDFFFLGGYDSRYVGLGYGIKTKTSIKKLFTDKGAIFPLKEIVGNYNTLHVIDAENNMFACGANPMGEIGNGLGINFKDRAYQWNWTNGELLTAPTKIDGKWKNINTSNSITFYLYAQDLAGNLHSWGRNKAFSLGNGITLSIVDYGSYPNYLDVWKPTHVRPLDVAWKVVPFTGETNKPVAPVIPIPSTTIPTEPQPETILKSLHDQIVSDLVKQIQACETGSIGKDNQIQNLNKIISEKEIQIAKLVSSNTNMKSDLQMILDKY